ncbi:MAG: S41 family peptidase [Deferribacterales bacterium]
MKYIVMLFISFLLVSCGFEETFPTDGNPGNNEYFRISYAPDDCTEAGKVKFVYKYMHDAYLWADEAPVLDYTLYASQYDIMNDLKVSQDRFSGLNTLANLISYYYGETIGLGTNLVAYSNRIYVKYVIPGTPADIAGLKRGYEILSVNGYSTAAMLSDSSVMDAAFGPSAAGVQNEIVYSDYDSVSHTVTLTKTAYYNYPVLSSKVFKNSSNGKMIGYLAYSYFNANYNDLDSAFYYFSRRDVEELIIDLRYNGGGLNDTAGYLASQILGSTLERKVFEEMQYNRVYSIYNFFYYFQTPKYPLYPEKIVFLVSGSTASSSELLINSIKAYKDVYLIGRKTVGKNVGMDLVAYCDMVMTAITFRNADVNGNSDFANGFEPDCYKTDPTDAMKDFGDPDEVMLSAAINYLQTGVCVPDAKNRSDENDSYIDEFRTDPALK